MQQTTTNNSSDALRGHAAASVERRRTNEYVRFASTPGVIHHPDGVLEIPETQTVVHPIFELIPNKNFDRR